MFRFFNKKEKEKNVMSDKTIQNIINPEVSDTDPNGSYTGVPVNRFEKPVQDADDL